MIIHCVCNEPSTDHTHTLARVRVQRSRNNCAQGGEPGNEAIVHILYTQANGTVSLIAAVHMYV